MRVLAVAILAIGAIWAAGPARAQTFDPHFPVCMHVYGDPTYYECRFGSLAACAGSVPSRSALRCALFSCFRASFSALRARAARSRSERSRL